MQAPARTITAAAPTANLQQGNGRCAAASGTAGDLRPVLLLAVRSIAPLARAAGDLLGDL